MLAAPLSRLKRRFLTADAGRGPLAVSLTALVLAGSFGYRLSTAIFTNDDYLHLSMAQQVLLGDLPLRDFLDPGRFLEYMSSAAAQAALGYNLLSEALLAVTLMSVGYALLFRLARGLSGSSAAALLVTTATVFTFPRLYNYPKVLLPTLGLMVIWGYAEDRGRRTLLAIAAVASVAFLYRHDYGAYVALPAAVMIVLTDLPRGWRVGVTRVASVAGLCLLLVAPYLAFVQWNTGLMSYFRTTFETAADETRRTQTQLPWVELDWDGAVPRLKAPPPAQIHVRWAPTVSADDRSHLERTLGLSRPTFDSGRTWRYDLADATPARIRRLVLLPSVEDTQGIDRKSYVLATRVVYRNAVAFVFYLLVSIPLVVLGAGIRSWSSDWKAPTPVAAKLISGAVLCLLANAFLLRAVSESRLGDAAAPVAVLAAWLGVAGARLAVAGLSRSAGARRQLLATVTALTMGLVIVGTGAAIARLEGVYELRKGVGSMRGRLVGPVGLMLLRASQLAEQPPFDLELARYLGQCTAPEDRVLATWYAPEIFYQSQRGFAGGRAYFLRSLGSAARYQRHALDRLAQESVPLVLDRSDYRADFDDAFGAVSEYLAEHYVVGGQGRLDGMELQVLVDAKRPVASRYGEYGLPCFQ